MYKHTPQSILLHLPIYPSASPTTINIRGRNLKQYKLTHTQASQTVFHLYLPTVILLFQIFLSEAMSSHNSSYSMSYVNLSFHLRVRRPLLVVPQTTITYTLLNSVVDCLMLHVQTITIFPLSSYR